MEEKDLNRIIVRSLSVLGTAHKISDESQSQKPYDYFGTCGEFIIFGESKFLKGYRAFNFSKIQDHQIQSLISAKETAKNIDRKKILSVLSLGIWEPHKYFHLYFFDVELIQFLKNNGAKSLKKRDLEYIHKVFSPYHIKNQRVLNIESVPFNVIGSFS